MTAVKFTFDTNFDPDDPSGGLSDARRRRSYTNDEIEAIRTAAYEDGRRSGEVRATEMLAASVMQFAEAVRDALSVIDKDVEAIRADAAQLALAAATKLASAALAHAPDAEIADTLRVALHEAISETHVTVKAAPGLVHELQDKLTEVAVQEGFEGRLRFVPDATLYGADCRIEWRGGGIERAHGRIEEHLADLIARRFPPLNRE
jgi:flagellar assembly protein FliH